MVPDDDNYYRTILKTQPPIFFDRVNTPWDSVPDLMTYNEHAYNRILRALQSVKARQQTAQRGVGSEGLLIFGEAGTGKTHLLMRIAQRLAATNRILFVPRPNNEESMIRHIWTEMVQSLTQPISTATGQRSQLDDLLAHVFSRVLIPKFKEDIAANKDAKGKSVWVQSLEADPYNLFKMLGKGAQRQKNLTKIKERTLQFLQQHPDVDLQIAGVLLEYCFCSEVSQKRIYLEWLAGKEQSKEDSERLSLPDTWEHLDAVAERAEISLRREQKALQAIATIGRLSTYYEPLILAFDQLEGLRGNKSMTHAWGDAVLEILTHTPNLLILSCIFPSLWREWFSDENVLQRSVTDRIAPGNTVDLEAFKVQHAHQLLSKHLEIAVSLHSLPDAIYPFEQSDLDQLCRDAPTPRRFLQAAYNRFEDWLEGKPVLPTEQVEQQTTPTIDQIDRHLRDRLKNIERKYEEDKTYQAQLLVEHELFGRVSVIIHSILANSPAKLRITNATFLGRVLPPNFVIGEGSDPTSICIAVSLAEGNSFTACVGNLLNVRRLGNTFRAGVLLRDRRSRTITGKVALQHLADLESQGVEYIILGKDEFVLLNAIYDLLVAAEEYDLSIGPTVLTKSDVVRFLRDERVGRRSIVLSALARPFMPLAVELALNPSLGGIQGGFGTAPVP